MLKFTKEYKFAHNGVRVECFQPGQEVAEPTAELYDFALRAGVAVDPSVIAEPEPEPEPEPAEEPKPKKTTKTKA